MRAVWRRHDGGQTLVEFALILPVFILLLVGVFDFGRAIYAYNTLNNAAHEAVRLGIVDQNVNAIRDVGRQHAVALGMIPVAGDNALVDNTGADVVIRFLEADFSGDGVTNDCAIDPRFGCIVEVEVDYTYNAATPVIGTLVGTLDFAGSSRQQIERTFESP